MQSEGSQFPAYLSPLLIEQQVAAALAEDIGSGDLTAELISGEEVVEATILCRDSATLCGIPWAKAAFYQCHASIEQQWWVADGESVAGASELARLRGPAGALLTAERTALNFMQLLSGVASLTRRFVEQAHRVNPAVDILDTRKTIPGLRLAQKYAVLCGGGKNHRIGLYDAILIKENHIAAAGSIAAAITRAQQRYPEVLIEIEVETLQELQQALDSGCQRILLDNMSPELIAEAVAITAGAAELEVSGGVTLQQLPAIAALGVRYISVGAITKQVEPVDLSMRLN
ncbi:carboxylating nicotinate-nucleotide diphosphorylase [Ectothiorhodospiraceae bacterium BW-2]|nr:carboxylating nicotinate-nucleotide diphosphorylase [Ectothiorhodospiraceae bacterium BW-2]